ncbi:helix-turn-helix domain-containing protein [Ornithinimicrobium sp. Arc0846-15]|nr:helix-turn-helix domain-containing protein [Ornithinimicrobium laminariae]
MFDRPTIRPDALRHAREAAGLTQHQLAVRLELSGGERVSSWETGRVQPHFAQLRNLSVVLGISIADLLDLPDGGLSLRLMRLRTGLEISELAKNVGVSSRTVRRWEEGEYRRLPAESRQADLAQALLVSPAIVREALLANGSNE